MNSSHFGTQDAAAHLKEKRGEIHGDEMPGHILAAAESAKESSVLFLLLATALTFSSLSKAEALFLFTFFGIGWALWKTARAAHSSWSRLERLHRIIEQEKYEIEHNREEEREELVVLYKNKGLEGKLLEDVCDVLMADQDRLLKIMVEEEMGLTLEIFEHPLKQACGACLGVLIAGFVALISFVLLPFSGMAGACFLVLAIATIIRAKLEKNRLIASVVWNVAIASLAFGALYFILQ